MRKLLVIALFVAGCHRGSGSPSGGPGGTPSVWPPPRPGYTSPIAAENARPGDPDWAHFAGDYSHSVEAYADRVSAKAGETVHVMASSAAAQGATWQLYRLGFYAGAGARKVVDGGAISLSTQPPCPNDAATGLVRCAWAQTFAVAVPQDAVSGLYLVRIVRADGRGTWVPLVVRDDRPADLYFQSSVTTFQAYNKWGGESLYADADDGLAGRKAVKVSFDRPYLSDYGSGQMLRYEASMARFLERMGYDVSYTTNLDVAREGSQALVQRGAFLSVGHDEYWPGEERDAVEGARDAGKPVLFFGANVGYWKVRLEDKGEGGNARTIVCYKQDPAQDPLVNTRDATGRYRDPPFDRPEDELVGTMYESYMLFGHPWVVSDASSPVYEGTGLANGDAIPLLVGYEYDRTFTPGAASVIASSPVVDAENKPGLSEATTYRAKSGALVFGAGSIYWAWGLDAPKGGRQFAPQGREDARVQRMTANLLHEALGLPVPAALSSVTAPRAAAPIGRWATSVATVAKGMTAPAAVAQLPDGSLVVADPRANQIVRIAGGAASPYAGDGNPSFSPAFDNIAGARARFFAPTGVAADAAGNVYVADTHNHAIRKVAADASHTVTTLAGAMGAAGFADGSGGAARFNLPMGVALSGGKLLVADSGNSRLRAVDLSTGNVTTVAGSDCPSGDQDGPALSACLSIPTAVAAAPDGRIFVMASGSQRLKVLSGGAVVSLTQGAGPGFADGSGTSALFAAQGGLAWSNGALLVADPGNQRVRIVAPGTDAASTLVKTLAGSGRVGAGDGAGDSASFGLPLGLSVASDGSVLVADGTGSVRSLRE